MYNQTTLVDYIFTINLYYNGFGMEYYITCDHTRSGGKYNGYSRSQHWKLWNLSISTATLLTCLSTLYNSMDHSAYKKHISYWLNKNHIFIEISSLNLLLKTINGKTPKNSVI